MGTLTILPPGKKLFLFGAYDSRLECPAQIFFGRGVSSSRSGSLTLAAPSVSVSARSSPAEATLTVSTGTLFCGAPLSAEAQHRLWSGESYGNEGSVSLWGKGQKAVPAESAQKWAGMRSIRILPGIGVGLRYVHSPKSPYVKVK